MSRVRLGAVLALGVAGALSVSLTADVKTQERTLMKFEGALGRVVGFLGGKAAKEGIVNTVAVQGNRRATMNDRTGEIVDLDEEKIYELDIRGKSYKVTTFAEMRKRMEEARARAEEEARKAEGRQEKEREQAPEKEYEIDFKVDETGQRKAINGFDCRQVISTITVREKGKTLEQAGGIIMTVDAWLTPKMAAMNEVQAFNQRYYQKLYGGVGMGNEAEQMAMAMALWPGMKEAMAKFQAEGGKLDGTPISTAITMAGAKSAEQAAAAKEDERPAGVGGMLGGLGRLGRKKPAEDQAAKPASSQQTIMTTSTEVLSVSTSVAPADVAIPAGFKEKK